MTEPETRIWLVRHGESLLNRLGRVQGWADAPLTLAGVAQAERRGRDFASAGQRFDAVVSADGVRHRETARGVLRGLGADLPLREDTRWRELCFGPLEGASGKRLEQLVSRHRASDDPIRSALEALAVRPDKSGSGLIAEAPTAVANRAVEALDAAADAAPGGDTLVVTSGLTILLLLGALGANLDDIHAGPAHLSVSSMSRVGGSWRVERVVQSSILTTP